MMKDLPVPLRTWLRLRPFELELLRPSRRVVPLAWLLLCLGSAALLGAVMAVKPAWDRNSALARQRSQLEEALASMGAGPTDAPGAHGGAAGKGPGRETQAESQAIVDDLHRPWPALFEQLELAAAADAASVHVDQLSIDPRFAGLQMVAESRDLDKLVRFSQRLSGGGPVQTMTLTHHEWHDTLGAHVVSASLVGELAAPGYRAGDPAGAGADSGLAPVAARAPAAANAPASAPASAPAIAPANAPGTAP